TKMWLAANFKTARAEHNSAADTACAHRRGDRVMRRREFITLLGAAATWPLAVRAQQSQRVRRIGALQSLAADDLAAKSSIAAFTHRLQELGWAEGRNLHVDYYWAAGDLSRVRAAAVELARAQPDVIFTAGSPSLRAAQQATHAIPIVFV